MSDLNTLYGKRIAIVGRLEAMAKKTATALLRRNGAIVCKEPTAPVDLLVVGERELLELDDELLGNETLAAIDAGNIEVISESTLWGWFDNFHDETQGEDVTFFSCDNLLTPAMLARLLNVETAIIRSWWRRGLIEPSKVIHQLPYFDYQEVVTARRLAELVTSGKSPEKIKEHLEALARWFPGAKRPLAQLALITEHGQLLVEHEGALLEPSGQSHFNFSTSEEKNIEPQETNTETTSPELDLLASESGAAPYTLLGEAIEQVLDAQPEFAMQMRIDEAQQNGEWEMVVTLLRLQLLAKRDNSVALQLAEALIKTGELAAAKERLFSILEQEPNHLEARMSLAELLALDGETETAVALLVGALKIHPNYHDARWRLAQLLDLLGCHEDATEHWKKLLQAGATMPWSEEAEQSVRGER